MLEALIPAQHHKGEKQNRQTEEEKGKKSKEGASWPDHLLFTSRCIAATRSV
jgi:hypothetical protein